MWATGIHAATTKPECESPVQCVPLPFGATPTTPHDWVAAPAHRCWPAQLLPGESTKKLRGMVTWNSPHCQTSAAHLNGMTVQNRSALPQPATRLPGKVHAIDEVAIARRFDSAPGHHPPTERDDY